MSRRLEYFDSPEGDSPCGCCGKFGAGIGHHHDELGWVCDSCWSLLHDVRMSGMIPTAYEEGRLIRMKRPNSNRL